MSNDQAQPTAEGQTFEAVVGDAAKDIVNHGIVYGTHGSTTDELHQRRDYHVAQIIAAHEAEATCREQEAYKQGYNFALNLKLAGVENQIKLAEQAAVRKALEGLKFDKDGTIKGWLEDVEYIEAFNAHIDAAIEATKGVQ